MSNKNGSSNETNAVEEQAFQSRLQECPIAVVGMASIFANAKSLDEYWSNIVESIDAISDVPTHSWKIDDYYDEDKKSDDKTYCKRGGFLPEIDFDPMEFGLPPNIVELTDIAQLLSLVVAREVLADAGLSDESTFDRDKIGITLGVGGGQKQIAPLISRLQGPVLEKVLKASGVEASDREQIIEKYKKAYIRWEENSFPGMLGNVIAGRIANRFNFGGTNCVVDAACAGSLAAIKLAISDLLEYRSEVMISGGVCCDNSPFMYMSFAKTPAFTTNDDIRPFDDNSKGMMIGEGIGMMAFKRLEDAERDGDKIYAVLKGIGTSSDGRFKSIYAPRPDGQAKALQRAYDDAGFDPKTCGLVEAHGTGTKAGDAAEFSGLKKHFSQGNDKKQHIALGSVKSQIGHAKAAAGAAGMIKAILALHHKVLPPTIHIDKPIEALDIENSPLYLNSETRPWMAREDGMPRRAGISSFGFGGTNYHMVLEEYQSNASGNYRLNIVPQTIVIAADSSQELLSCLNGWQQKINEAGDKANYTFNELVVTHGLKTPEQAKPRCGFSAKNAEDALVKISSAIKQLQSNAEADSWSLPSGVFYRQQGIDAAGKMVALFSGQGSQYVNMGKELLCNFPVIRETAEAMDANFSDAGAAHLSSVTYPIPVFTEENKKSQDLALRNTKFAQPAIGALSLGMYKAFAAAGLTTDFVAGHSFGELTALCASGVISEADYLTLARSRGDAMASSAKDSGVTDPGKMAAVVGEPEKVEKVIAAIEGVSVANYNANNQVVIAGASKAIESASMALSKEQFKVIPLPVSAAFHTPLVAHAQAPFAKVIDSIIFSAPTVKVFSNATGEEHVKTPAKLKKSLKEHILQSVRFSDEIRNIYQQGGRVFVEFGPKNVLTKLVGNILGGHDDVHAIALNASPKKCADLQFRDAAVQLAVLGVSLNEVDTYSAVKRPIQAPKSSPLTMKLNGSSYVSDKTKQGFEDALTDGWKIEQVAALVEKENENQRLSSEVRSLNETNQSLNKQKQMLSSEKERLVQQSSTASEHVVEVEKTVYLNPDGTTFEGQVNVKANHVEVNNVQVNNVKANTGKQEHLSTENPIKSDTEYRASSRSAMNKKAQSSSTIESQLSTFVEQQQQMLKVHQQYMEGPKSYARTFEQVLNNSAGDELAPSIENSLSMYHQFQSDTLRVHQQYLEQQSQVMSSLIGAQVPSHVLPQAAPSSAGEHALPTSQPSRFSVNQSEQQPLKSNNSVPVTIKELSNNAAKVAETTTVELETATPAAPAKAVSTNSTTVAQVTAVMLEVVAEKTGYPSEMLELEMDMEADLGIDSIKRVEILGSVQESLSDLPDLNPEDLAELRTLGEIVTYMQEQLGASSAQTSALSEDSVRLSDDKPLQSSVNLEQINVEKINAVMMTVVADKTGYPSEMLELDMDMEADLGIDSIKRVEILGAVQESIENLPELNPEDLVELRTLGEIVTYMETKAQSVVATPTETNTEFSETTSAVSSAAINLDEIQSVMMSVVADKTGYPSDMLELEMDMEADLGIDSIKRVEILGAVQESIAELPDLNPEDLAELRTLGEIVDYMQSQASLLSPSSSTLISTPAKGTVVESKNHESLATVESATNSASVASLSVDAITPLMMQVVADKTGYPSDMLELSMDMEADLGIDSIKRVEILGAVQESVSDLPELNPEDLAELRTLGEIVSHMQSKLPTASVQVNSVETASSKLTIDNTESSSHVAVVSAPTLNVERIQSVMMDVVADKTGYPSDMLELEMDMEADLGIDSIKRVEILGAVQDSLENLPELNPEDLAEKRTLGDIVSYLQSKVGEANTSAQGSNASTQEVEGNNSLDVKEIESIMLSVVADKTGYPSDMLELEMDMEADLGIDSIKRVEILGAVQDSAENLPELDAERLAELRTLGEIVVYMQAQMSSGVNGSADVSSESKMTSQAELQTNEELQNKAEEKDQPAAFEPAPSAVVDLISLNSVNQIAIAGNARKALVVDDGTGAAASLASQLISDGWQIVVLKPRWLNAQSKKAFDKQATVINLTDVEEASVESIFQSEGQFSAIFVLNEKAQQADVHYQESSKKSLQLTFLLAKYSQLKTVDNAQGRASFIVVTRQGGTLGFVAKNAQAPAKTDLVQGGQSGLVKTMSHEWPNVFCRIVDLSSKLSADKSAQAILDEFRDVDTSIKEVAYDTDNLALGGRVTLSANATNSYDLANSESMNEESVVLVSGGAKGVTAQCTIELAKNTKAKFILLGRSGFEPTEAMWTQNAIDESELKKLAMQTLLAEGQKPTPVSISKLVNPVLANREIKATLQAIEEVGGQATYIAADVTDMANLKQAIAPAVSTYGNITAIIHGAGVLADKFIEQKIIAEFDRVYQTKVTGLEAMLSVVASEQIKHLVLFSSAAGFYGNPGQADYAVANEILNKTAYRFKSMHPQAQVLTFNWGPWDGGMVTPELKRMFNERGAYIIPVLSGANLLVNELLATDNRSVQVLVGNDLSTQQEEQIDTKLGDTEQVSKGEKAGDLAKKSQVSLATYKVTKSLSAANNAFLEDHEIGDDKVLPTVCALAWMSDAAQSIFKGYDVVEFRKYQLFKGIVFDGNQSSAFDLELKELPKQERSETKYLSVKISSDDAAGKRSFHYQAELVLAESGSHSRADSCNGLISEGSDNKALIKSLLESGTSVIEAASLYQDGTLFHGPSFQSITNVLQCDESNLVLSCFTPDISNGKRGDFALNQSNIFANDTVYQSILVWVKTQLGFGSLPSSTLSWTVNGQIKLGETFYLVLKVAEKTKSQVIANVQVFDEAFELIADVKGAQVTVSENLTSIFTKGKAGKQKPNTPLGVDL